MMGLTWYVLGALAAGSAYVLWKYSRRNPLNWISWAGMTLGIVLILFSIAWAVGAVLEGVPRAASMGLLLFGLGGIVVLTATSRYISKHHGGGTT
jgi:tryptophan-rich sensory protein